VSAGGYSFPSTGLGIDAPTSSDLLLLRSYDTLYNEFSSSFAVSTKMWCNLPPYPSNPWIRTFPVSLSLHLLDGNSTTLLTGKQAPCISIHWSSMAGSFNHNMTTSMGNQGNTEQTTGCPTAQRTESLDVWPSDSDLEINSRTTPASPPPTRTETVKLSCMMERYLQANADVHVHKRLWAESLNGSNKNSSKKRGTSRPHKRPRNRRVKTNEKKKKFPSGPILTICI